MSPKKTKIEESQEEIERAEEKSEIAAARKFGLGHLPGGKLPSKSFRHRFGAPASLPKEGGVLDCIPRIRNQGQYSRCVGVRLAQNIDIQFIAQTGRTDFDECSGNWPYAGARMLEEPEHVSTLIDRGSYPGLALDFLQKHGVATAKSWSDDGENVNVRPDVTALDSAFAYPLVDAYASDASSWSEKILDLKMALAAKHVPGAATRVDSAFDKCSPGDKPLGAPDENDDRGGHYIGVVYWQEQSDGSNLWWLLNQWDVGWGHLGGIALATDEFVCRLSDIIIVQAIPQHFQEKR